MEERLSKYERPGDTHLKEGQRPHSSASALQRELESVRERSKKELSDLKQEIERLRKDNAALRSKESSTQGTCALMMMHVALWHSV